MKRENDEITDLFHSRLGHAEMTVRESFWEELKRDAEACSHRRRIVFFRVAAAASVLLVLAASSATFWFLSPKEEMEEAFTQLAISGMGSLDGDGGKQSYTPIHSQPVLQKPTPKTFGTLAQFSAEEEDDSITMTMSFSFSVSSSTSQVHSGNNSKEDYLWRTGTDSGIPGQTDDSSDFRTEEPVVQTVKRHSSLALKAAVGMALPAENGDYKMPVTAGISLEKRLNKYLGIETGLAYTKLRSKGQNLHYLGIPVKMNVFFADTEKLDLYASLGGMADKCIAGAPDNDFKHEPIQLAVTAGIGVNYKINDRIALFAEPGVSHHFKTDSKFETVRTKRPVNFNLICGLRMTY